MASRHAADWRHPCFESIHCPTSTRPKPLPSLLTNVPASLCLGFLELDHDMKILRMLPSRDEESHANSMVWIHQLFVPRPMYDTEDLDIWSFWCLPSILSADVLFKSVSGGKRSLIHVWTKCTQRQESRNLPPDFWKKSYVYASRLWSLCTSLFTQILRMCRLVHMDRYAQVSLPCPSFGQGRAPCHSSAPKIRNA